MNKESKLLDMLRGYAASHQHPFNIGVHLIGIPVIMLGILIPLSWAALEINDFRATFAQILVVAMFAFYVTLDRVFASVFLLFGLLLAALAEMLGDIGQPTSGIIAAAAFFGGYLAQFVGHAVEKSAPVILKHPIQANLAAPFFTIVEIFHIFGLRKKLFEEVRGQTRT
jgi:uncharacterized membrane protein YGL010W